MCGAKEGRLEGVRGWREGMEGWRESGEKWKREGGNVREGRYVGVLGREEGEVD